MNRNGGDGIFFLDPLFPIVVTFKDCSVSENAASGLHTGDRSIDKLTVVRTTIADNGDEGVYGAFENPRVLLKASTITGNGGYGIANRQRLPDRTCEIKIANGSIVTGNGASADCGVTRACADVASCTDHMPQVSTDSSCDTSYQLETGIPGTSWGICASD